MRKARGKRKTKCLKGTGTHAISAVASVAGRRSDDCRTTETDGERKRIRTAGSTFQRNYSKKSISNKIDNCFKETELVSLDVKGMPQPVSPERTRELTNMINQRFHEPFIVLFARCALDLCSCLNQNCFP